MDKDERDLAIILGIMAFIFSMIAVRQGFFG